MSKKTGYVACWLEQAYQELSSKPSNILADFVLKNILGGKYGWEPEIEELFSKPEDSEEVLLRLEVCSVLEIALANMIVEATRRINRHQIHGSSRIWKIMHIGFGFYLAKRIAKYNPLCAIRAKIQLNLLCQQLGETLFSISNDSEGFFFQEGEIGIDW